MMSTLARPDPTRPMTVLLILLALDAGGAKAQTSTAATATCPDSSYSSSSRTMEVIIPDMCPCKGTVISSNCGDGSFCCSPDIEGSGPRSEPPPPAPLNQPLWSPSWARSVHGA